MFSISHTSSHLLAWTFSPYNPIFYVFETPYLLSKVLELEPDEIQENFGPRFSLFLLTLEYYFDEVSSSEFDAYNYDVQDSTALFHVSESESIMSYSSVETTTRAPVPASQNSKQAGIVPALTELNIRLLNSLPSVDDGGYLDIALQLLALLSLSLCTICLICATVV